METKKLLEKVKDNVEDAIKPILKKGEAMTPADLESLTKALCIIDTIRRIEGTNTYDDGYSYERGRSPITGRYVSRDAMPHHDARYYDTNGGASTRRYYDGATHHGYSGHSIQDRMIATLERMIDDAQTEHERKTIKDYIRLLRD